jgi:hypothetical protein
LISPFPVTRYEIKSFAKPAEIAALLSTHVKSYTTYTRGDKHKTFTGSVSENGFRVVLARKKFERMGAIRPSVSGDFRLSSESTIIDVTIKYDSYLYLIPFVIFFIFIASFNLQDNLLPLLEAFSTHNIIGVLNYFPPLLQPFSFMIIVYIALLISLVIQTQSAKGTLEEILAPLIIK